MGAPELQIVAEEESVERSGAPAERLGPYRLDEEIGAGGMASVFLAVPDGATARDVVALKRVHPHLAVERGAIEMFLDEARIAAQLDHPNVCPVLDYGMTSGTYFLTMPFLRGRPLRDVMRAMRCMPSNERVVWPVLAARTIADAAAGLHAAHELRDPTGSPLHVVHRDVSPHNLFVTWDGVVKVVDFGIAHARDRVHQTETGMVKGKFAYMAPEQMRGAVVDRRADVWSLGVVFFELLSGRPLFGRRTQSETVVAVTSGDRPSLDGIAPWVPAELVAIVDRALAVELDERYPTAEAMRDDLERYLAAQPGPADAEEVAAWMRALFDEGPAEDEARVERAVGEVLPEIGEHEAIERSRVRRRSSGPPPAKRPLPRVALFVLALIAAIAVGALAGMWPQLAAQLDPPISSVVPER